MPTAVPYDPVPSVSPQLAPTPPARNVPGGAFGELSAHATSELGQAIRQTGNEVFARAMALQLLNQQAAADEATSDFQMKSALQHNEMLSRTGKDAADNLVPALEGIERTRQDIRSGLSSPYAQMLYDRETRRTQGQLMTSASRHASTEQRAYTVGSLQARSDAADNVALSLPQDDTAFEASLAEKDRIADQMAEQGVFRGGKVERDNWATRAKSTLTLNRVTGIARTGDPFTAERMAERAIANKTLVGQDIATATTRIYYQQNTTGARLIANRILSGEGSVAGGGPVPLGQAAEAVGQYLSKDNYDLIGSAHDGTGRALGRYGVPAEKLSAMLREAGMPDMSDRDFLKSHQAQDQLFSRHFGRLQDETGNFNDALLKWVGREPTPVSGVGTTEQKQAFDFFKSKGWSEPHAHAMVATLSGESGSHLNTMANQKAGGRNWKDRFEVSDPTNGIANWDNERSRALEGWAKAQGLDPDDLMTQLRFVDYEARQMGFDPASTGDPRTLTLELTGSTESGRGYEKPLVNNGSERWARYSGQRYAHDPAIQQTNGLLARNAPVESLVEQGRRTAANLAPNNPLFSEYLTDRILGLHRQEASQHKAEEYQSKQILEAALNPDEQGRIPTSVEELQQRGPEVAQAFDHASPTEQRRIQGVLSRNLVAGGIEFTPETFRRYASLHAAAIDPTATPQQRQELLDANVSDLNIPLRARQQLFSDQQKVYKAEEASPQMGRAIRVLGPILSAIDLTKKDTDNYNLFLSELHDAIQQHNRDFPRPITDDEIKQIGTQLLRDQPQSGFWSWFTTAEKWYQLPVPAEYTDKVRADPRWAEVGVDPTDEMVRTMYVQQQFQHFYSKRRAPAGPTPVGAPR